MRRQVTKRTAGKLMQVKVNNYVQHSRSGNLTRTHQQTEDISWDELILSAISVGRRPSDLPKLSGYPYFKGVARALNLQTTLEHDWNGHDYIFKPSETFRSLDPTEKGAETYALGTIMTQVLSDRYLGIWSLLHIDVYRRQNPFGVIVPTRFHNNNKPDMIGCNAHKRFGIFEAKGRRGRVDPKLRENAKRQAQCAYHQCLGDPDYQRACCATLEGEQLSIDWIDPEGVDGNPVEIDTPPLVAVATGYTTVYNMLAEGDRQVHGDTVLVNVPEGQFSLCMRRDLYETFTEIFEPYDGFGYVVPKSLSHDQETKLKRCLIEGTTSQAGTRQARGVWVETWSWWT